MLGKSRIMGLIVFAAGASALFAADDQPKQPYWTGRVAEKTKSVPIKAEKKEEVGGAEKSAKRPAEERDLANQKQDEPEWLKRLDKNDRFTLTGGWKLQNISGGPQSFTTTGDRAGLYAPNTYQGQQFQQWHNLATRLEIPSWNGSAAMFPPGMWSQGYISPNNYFGGDSQTWCGMSAGQLQPNMLSGGWTWR